MKRYKQNITGRNNRKFESFENTKDDKFSVYKYERNVLVGRIDNYSYANSHEDHEYIEQIIPIEKDKQGQDTVKKSNESNTENVDNLCDLWDKLGHQDNVHEERKTEVIELTEEQLMQCFGDSQTHQDQRNKIIATETIAKNSECKENQDIKKDIDDDLMEIWGEDQRRDQQQSQSSQSEKQTNIDKDLQFGIQKSSLEQQKQQYVWEDESSIVAKKQKQPENIYQAQKFQTLNLQQKDESFEMELEDPNQLNLHPIKKLSDKISTKVSAEQENIETPLQAQKTHEMTTEFQKQTKPQSQSIQKQILLEKNNKSMTKLIPGQDYEIFNQKLFVSSQFKPDTYSYFGIEIRSSSLLDPKNIQKSPTDLKEQQGNFFYFYSFETKQAFLQLKPQPFQKQYQEFLSVKKTITYGPGLSMVKTVMEYNTDACFKIRICSTKEHIATMFYKVIKDGFLFDLRLFDVYEQTHSEPIALIEVKDGFVNECCYCDTNVFIEKKTKQAINSKGKAASPKKQAKKQPGIEKLKMILNIKNGKLTANMGINGIQSSPYNSCLENQQTNKFVYLMGLLCQDKAQKKEIEGPETLKKKKNGNKFIVKIGQGVSPLLGLAITAGRKLYIDSFG